jgi:hypothetical protein
MSDITLTAPELVALTGYRRPSEQLDEPHRLGFARARRSPTDGAVILERAHYEAVCAGQKGEARPKVRPPQVRVRAAA